VLEQRIYGLVYEYVGAWNRHDAGELAVLYADDALYEDLGLGLTLHGAATIRSHLRQVFTDCPDAALALGAEPVAGGDRACFEWMMVRNGNGQVQELRGVSVMLIEDGQIVRQTDYPHLAVLGAARGTAGTEMRAAAAAIEDNIAWGE
jgi:steroid delta-isomerase-like uncharacterized protein